jgi:ribosomal protein L14
MHAICLFILALSLNSATVIDVEPHTEIATSSESGQREMVLLAVRIGNMIYTVDFYSSRSFRPTQFKIGDTVQAGVEHGRMTVQRRHGKSMKAPIVRQQRIILEPR